MNDIVTASTAIGADIHGGAAKRAGAPSSLPDDFGGVAHSEMRDDLPEKITSASEEELREYIYQNYDEDLYDAFDEAKERFIRAELEQARVGNSTMPIWVKTNGVAAEFVSRTMVVMHDLPELGSTACITPGGRIFVNAKFFERLQSEAKSNPSVDPFEFLLQHEAEHGLRQHFTRFNDYDSYSINIAGDMVINLSIQIDHALRSIKETHPNFKLPIQNVRESNEWKILRDAVIKLQSNLAPSIKAGIGMEIQHFDKYALMGTSEVLAKMNADGFLSPKKNDNPNRKIDVRDVFEGAAQDMERLASHTAIVNRPVDAQNPYDLTKLCPVLAEDLRRVGELLSGKPKSDNKHVPSPSENAGVQPTYSNPKLAKKEMTEILGRTMNYQGSSEYLQILDVDHKALSQTNQNTVNTGDQWVDGMTPSERLKQVVDIMRQVLLNKADANASNSSGQESDMDIFDPYNKSRSNSPGDEQKKKEKNKKGSQSGSDGDSDGEGGGDPSEGSADQGAGTANKSKMGDPSQLSTIGSGSSRDGGQSNSDSLEGAMPDISVGDTVAQGAESGTFQRAYDEHSLDTKSEVKALEGYKTALEQLGLDDPENKSELANSSKGQDLATTAMESYKKCSDAVAQGGGGPAGAHRADSSYAQVAEFYAPVLSLGDLFASIKEDLRRFGRHYDEAETPHIVTISPDWNDLMMGMEVFIPDNLPVPAKFGPTVSLIVDTSGSVSDELLVRFMSEVRGMLNDLSDMPVKPKFVITTADTTSRTLDVASVDDVANFLSKAMVVGGRGGTDFTGSILSTLKEFGPNGRLHDEKLEHILYFTDGGDSPPNTEAIMKACETLQIKAPSINFLIPDAYTDKYFQKTCESNGVGVTYFNPKSLGNNEERQVIELTEALSRVKDSEPQKKTKKKTAPSI